jgi:hypothetical protein
VIIKCPHCGKPVAVNGLGRKRLNISLKNVCECLQTHHNVVTAANELGCSPAYIFGVLKDNGLKLRDVISGQELATKDNRLLHKEAVNDGRQE